MNRSWIAFMRHLNTGRINKCKLLVDIRGRDITIGAFEDNQSFVDIDIGEDIEIYVDVEGTTPSTKSKLVTSELSIDRLLRKGDLVYIGDGSIKCSVLSNEDGTTMLRTKSEGRVYEYSSIIIPDKHSSLSIIQERDVKDLEELSKNHKIDYISIPY